MEDRIKWIDNAKGLAILMVIIGHTCGDIVDIIDLRFVYGVHLVVFFLISGYTFNISKYSKNYLIKKLKKLMMPYAVTCLAVCIMDLINNYIDNKDSNVVTRSIVIDIIRSAWASGSDTRIFFWDIGTKIGAIWFLPALFIALLVFATIVSWKENDYIIAIVCFFLGGVAHYSAEVFWLPLSIQAALYSLPYICIGYIVRKHNALCGVQRIHYIGACFVLIWGIKHGYCFVNFAKATSAYFPISMVIGLSGALIVFGVSNIIRLGVISRIGRLSLYVLCFHLFCLNTLGKYISKFVWRFSSDIHVNTIMFMIFHIVFATVGAMVYNFSKVCLSRNLR